MYSQHFRVSSEIVKIPNGLREGFVISKQNLASSIVNRFDSVSRVYNISMYEGSPSSWNFMQRLLDGDDYFLVSFTVGTTSGAVYTDMECTGEVFRSDTGDTLIMRNCANDKAELSDSIFVELKLLTPEYRAETEEEKELRRQREIEARMVELEVLERKREECMKSESLLDPCFDQLWQRQ